MSVPNSTIKRIAVESSCLASIGYLTEAEILQVEFRSGVVYRYFHVPFAIYCALLDAESKGAFFSRFIKTRYSAKRMNLKAVPMPGQT